MTKVEAVESISRHNNYIFSENPEAPPRSIKMSKGGHEYIIEEKSPEKVIEMKEIAQAISSIPAREELDAIMDVYRESLQKGIEGDNIRDFDRLSQDAQIYIMITMRKDGANAQQLEEFAELNIIVLRDQINKEQRDWKKATLAIVGGSVIVVASIVGAAASWQAINAVTKTAAGIAKTAQFASSAGQGVKSFESCFESKTQATVTFLNSSKDIAQSKKGQNSDQKRRADQSMEAARRAAEQILQNRHQTVLVFVRNNY